MRERLWLAAAPMEGVVDSHVRDLLTQIGGLDHACTEFVRVTDRLLPAHVVYGYAPELHNGGRTPSGVPVFVQLLGGQPQPMAENAAFVASLGALGVDLNFGCPAKTVNRHDGGATLLKNPERVFAVTSAVRAALPKLTPLTVKVRLGFDHKEFAVEIAQAAAAGGAERLTVHARTRNEMYVPPAHWEYIARMREAVAIQVVANGEIWSVEDFLRAREVTGCTAFALGRGLMARPDLALQIARYAVGELVDPLPWSEIQKIVLQLLRRLEAISPALAIGRVKQWCRFLSRTYPEAEVLFDRIKVLKCPNEMRLAFKGHAQPNPSFTEISHY